MRYIPGLMLFAALVHGETLIDKLSEGNVSKIPEVIKDNRKPETKEQERLRKLTEQPAKPIDNIAVEVIKVDVNKKTSVGVEYAPPLKQGEAIDNKEQTTIKVNYEF